MINPSSEYPTPEYLTATREIFKKYKEDYGLIKQRLDAKEKDRLSVYSHFYYYMCAPHKKDTRQELQIIAMTSLIEALMNNHDFKDVFEYFDTEFKKTKEQKNIIDDVESFKKGYYAKYGATKKIVAYFELYPPSKEREQAILNGVYEKQKKEKSWKPLENLEEFAKLLYQMRSDFVHKAMMPNFGTTAKIGESGYRLSIGISAILEAFEESFVTYWKKKAFRPCDTNMPIITK